MKTNLMLLAVILILILPSCDFIRERNPFNKRARERDIQLQIDSIRKADSLQKVNFELKLKAQQDSLAAVEAVRAEEESFKYNIIVGSFLNPDYAQAHSDYYISRGYQPKVIDKADSHFKLVAAGSYQTMNEAWRALQGYRDTVELGSWIYVSR